MMIITILLLTAVMVVPGQSDIQRNASYLVTMVPRMEVGKEQKICTTLFNYRRLDVHYTIEGDNQRYFYQKQKYRRGQGGCVTFIIPREMQGKDNTLQVQINGPKGVRLHETTTFIPVGPVLKTYIQTDKPVYKPGQLVRLRILTIDSMLMVKTDQIPFIRIKTPNDVVMKQWRNVRNENGLVSLEYQLAKEPVLGKWTIHVGHMALGSFEVKEYVLPRFSVTIKPPARVNEKTETIDGEVCAKYTYGQPVKGKVMVESCIRSTAYWYSDSRKPCAVIQGEMTGCFSYSFPTSILRPHFLAARQYLKLVTFVAILDEATGVMVNQTKDGPAITKFSVVIDIKSHTKKFFKPLLPFEFKATGDLVFITQALVVDEIGKPTSGQVMTVWCREIRFRNKMVSDEKGFITHFFPRLGTEDAKINFKVRADDNENQKPVVFEATQWFSPSDSYLEIQPISKRISPGIVPINVYMTKPPPTPFRAIVQVMSRGSIVYHSQNRYKVRKNPDGRYPTNSAWCQNQKTCLTDKTFAPRVPSFTISLSVTCEMSPEAQMLIYYLTNNGEVVADTEYLKVEQCFKNKVKMSFSPAKEYPGYPTKLSLSAAPGSVCGVGVVDQSVFILGGKNQLSPQDLFSELSRYNAKPEWQEKEAESEEKYCQDWLNRTGLFNVVTPKSPYYSMRKVYKHRSDYVDSQNAFKMANLETLGSIDLRSRPCKKVQSYTYNRGRRSIDYDGSGMGPGIFNYDDEDGLPTRTGPTRKKIAPLRQHFPETWLWDVEVIGDSGKLELNKTLPGSITEWVGSAICGKSGVGVGVSESASVTAFQPFFLSFTLPYAAIRGEHIPITVTVFNYLTECMEIELRLNDSTEFELLNPSRITWMCVCGNEAKRHDFVIIPKTLGFINITAQAKSVPGDSQCPGVNATGDVVGIRDSVVRQLLVEPEGDEKVYSYSTMVCSDFYDLVDLPLFADQVPDSGRGVISVIGDLMGPSYSNIGNLLRVPYGCGEQNMVNFAPNVFIMRYLRATNKLTSEIDSTIEKYLGSGYQRELNYIRYDGSFSCYGNRDRHGNTFLTAFVIKTFTEARPFLDIDEDVIRRSRLWVKSKQEYNGCFREDGGRFRSSMRDAERKVAMTAYVLIALITAGTPKHDSAVRNAINCIVAKPITDVYALAITAHATALYGVNSRTHVTIQRKLDAKAIKNGSMIHWEAEPEFKDSYYYRQRASSLNVETTAYALLAYLEEDDLESSLKIVKWLETQRNPQGGFISTQDTVVALQALSMFARRASVGETVKMSLTVQGEDIRKNFITTGSNSMVMQTEQLKVPNEITVSGTGTGCALFKATVRYNTYSLKKGDLAFTLNTTVQQYCDQHPGRPCCDERVINICAAYVKGGSSGMAIISAKMVTGWKVDTELLEMWMSDPMLGLKRYEVDERRPDYVNFYFDSLDSRQRCLWIHVSQEIKVKNTKEAVVQVYDYYDTELVTKVFYSINNTCVSKPSKPDKPTTAAPGAGPTGLDRGMDIDGNTDERGTLRIDPSFLADGFQLQPNSIPVANYYSEFYKDEDDPVEVKVRLGSSAILPCPLRSKYSDTSDRQYKLAWVDESQNVIAVFGNRTLLANIKKFGLVDANLRIVNVTQKNSGKYQCQINTLPVQSVVVILHVQESPRIVASSNDTRVTAGSNVTLMCNVTGIPKPRVTWYNLVEGSVRMMQGKGEVLVLRSVQNSSEYRCDVTNGVPPDVSRQINVTVNQSSVVSDRFTSSILPTSATVTVMEGDLATLPCTVRNIGRKRAVWRRLGDDDGVISMGQYVITADKRLALQHKVRKDTSEVSDWNLLIKSARQSDSGIYVCQISGTIRQSRNVTLIVTVPVLPFILPWTVTRVEGVLGSTVVLQVHVMASPSVLPRWSRRGRALLDDKFSFRTINLGHNSYIVELRIVNVETQDFDDYKCELTNDFGADSGLISLYDATPTTMTPETDTAIPTVQTVAPFIPVGCPVCEPMLERQVIHAYCQAEAAYKVLGIRIRKSTIKVKILTDFRPLRRVKVRRTLRLVVESKCKCDVMKSLKSRTVLALFMNRKMDFASKPREVLLGSETIAMVLPKALERRIIQSRRKC